MFIIPDDYELTLENIESVSEEAQGQFDSLSDEEQDDEMMCCK